MTIIMKMKEWEEWEKSGRSWKEYNKTTDTNRKQV